MPMTPRAIALSLLVSLALVGCGGTPATTKPTGTPAGTPSASGGTVVQVTEQEFSITPNPTSVAAGTVSFNVKNNGTLEHEFLVLGPTGLPPEGLPSDDGGNTVDEEEVGVVAEDEGVPAGTSTTVTANLAAGNYVLICNIATHWSSGMRVAFTVH